MLFILLFPTNTLTLPFIRAACNHTPGVEAAVGQNSVCAVLNCLQFNMPQPLSRQDKGLPAGTGSFLQIHKSENVGCYGNASSASWDGVSQQQQSIRDKQSPAQGFPASLLALCLAAYTEALCGLFCQAPSRKQQHTPLTRQPA